MSERVSDTVFFKTKYITQPTLTPADIITKALNDLTKALKGKNNDEGVGQLEALKQLDAILNNVPEPVPTQVETRSTQRRVTFDKAANAPVKVEVRETIPTPRVIERPQRRRTGPIHTATIEKPIPQRPTPRVQNKQITNETITPRSEMRDRLRKHFELKTMARIPQRNTHHRRSTRNSERAQLIHDKDSNTYLNYRQLLRHPNYTKTWNISAAKGLKDGRVQGTNTIKFIQKDQVPTERIKDVTYGSFTCDF
jgi:hypothetical protein